MNPYEELSARGVAIWLDDLSKSALDPSDKNALKTDIEQRNVVGVTTNPSIFAAALKDGAVYAPCIRELLDSGEEHSTEDIALALMVQDVQQACDLLAPVFEETNGLNGRVSIEVDPRLAHDTAATVEQARMLWHLVDRPNLLVKIPATVEGLPAIAEAISEGISVNVTLIFSPDRYRAVMGAYLDGLHAAARNHVDLSAIRSVASLFISRTDAKVDPLLDKLAEAGNERAAELRGEVGLAIARVCYAAFEETFSQPRFTELDGAHVQRPLWASTGVKDPSYEATKYVVGLVAPDTVNTMPRDTLKAVGELTEIPEDTVTPNIADAEEVLASLDKLGIELEDVFSELEAEGVKKFEDSWDELIAAVQVGIDDASA
ncbi:transaldolase [Bowdeniella massiliensis]|uniref:transaldolase n=1 Tax=Bowdeniella massiliensis TaxID=2932264 RepID=UPI0020297ADA|nr:transaldolase [Bowdeniella massiliensis]